jgi:hypothetical protein
MHSTARPPLAEDIDAPARRWWVPGLVWWALFLGVLVVAVHECS